MPRFPTAHGRHDTIPSFLATARTFYGEAFGSRREAELAESMADWAELTEEERSFALAHLQYLNLVAQAGTQRMLARACELLEELVEYAEDAAFGDGADPEGDDEDEDDLDEVEWPEGADTTGLAELGDDDRPFDERAEALDVGAPDEGPAPIEDDDDKIEDDAEGGEA